MKRHPKITAFLNVDGMLRREANLRAGFRNLCHLTGRPLKVARYYVLADMGTDALVPLEQSENVRTMNRYYIRQELLSNKRLARYVREVGRPNDL